MSVMILFVGFGLFALAFWLSRSRRKSVTPWIPIEPPEPPEPPYRNEFAFDKIGYLALPRSRVSFLPTFFVRMELKTRTDSFVFGLGYMNDFESFVNCQISNGRLTFRTYAGPNEHQVVLRSKTVVSNGAWNVVEIRRVGDTWTMSINNREEDSVTESPTVTFPSTPLYVGTKPLRDRHPLQGYSGCIRNIVVGNDDNPPFELYDGVTRHCAV